MARGKYQRLYRGRLTLRYLDIQKALPVGTWYADLEFRKEIAFRNVCFVVISMQMAFKALIFFKVLIPWGMSVERWEEEQDRTLGAPTFRGGRCRGRAWEGMARKVGEQPGKCGTPEGKWRRHFRKTVTTVSNDVDRSVKRRTKMWPLAHVLSNCISFQSWKKSKFLQKTFSCQIPAWIRSFPLVLLWHTMLIYIRAFSHSAKIYLLFIICQVLL